MVGWAKSLTWAVTTQNECRTLFFSIHKMTENITGNTGYGFIIGPLTIMIGYAKKIEE